MNRLILLSLSIIGLQAANAQKPNIVLIVADDMGYGDLESYGCTDIRTPNIDRLAKQGVRFTSFYANGPECTPTRAALLTGRYQQRVGGLECAIGAGNVGRYDEAEWLSDKNELGLPPDMASLPRELKNAGYATAMMGKWHLGYPEKFRPNHQGFDYSLGPIGYGGDYFWHVEQDPVNLADFQGAHTLAVNGRESFRDGYYLTHLITDEAKSWINRQSHDTPFFLYLPYTAPHDPYQGPGDYLTRPLEGDEWKNRNRNRETYARMVEELDRGVGEILEVIDRKGMAGNTIVIFFSDNGGTTLANNGIFSGSKGQVYEGGIRVPCLIRWPGKISANTVSGQASATFDITCSLLSSAGIDTKPLNPDGIDIIRHIMDGAEDSDRTLFWRLKRGNRVRKAVRDGDLKYITEWVDGKQEVEKLFDLGNDPAEKTDLLLSGSHQADQLRAKLAAWEKEVESPRLRDFRK